ncbi:MAG: hypothetical protein ACRES3_07350 [Steroidobacteraceae bacterium]
MAAALADPALRFELLTIQFRADFGAEGLLPGKALALEAMKKRGRTAENLAEAHAEIEAALVGKQPVRELALQQLDKGLAMLASSERSARNSA